MTHILRQDSSNVATATSSFHCIFTRVYLNQGNQEYSSQEAVGLIRGQEYTVVGKTDSKGKTHVGRIELPGLCDFTRHLQKR